MGISAPVYPASPSAAGVSSNRQQPCCGTGMSSARTSFQGWTMEEDNLGTETCYRYSISFLLQFSSFPISAQRS